MMCPCGNNHTPSQHDKQTALVRSLRARVRSIDVQVVGAGVDHVVLSCGHAMAVDAADDPESLVGATTTCNRHTA